MEPEPETETEKVEKIEKEAKTIDEEDKKTTSNGTNGEKKEVIEEKVEVKEQKPKIGIKPLQFLTDPEAVAKIEEKDDAKIKIDDLIIIPNNINHAEEGGSALQVQTHH